MRHYKLILRIVTACAALGCCTTALGQNAADQNGTTQTAPAQKSSVLPNSINGPWTVTFTVQGQSVSGQMTFKADGEKLGGTVDTEHTGHGTLKGGAWLQNKLSGIYVFESHQGIAIAGEFKEGKIAGVFETEGMNGKWEAVPATAQP